MKILLSKISLIICFIIVSVFSFAIDVNAQTDDGKRVLRKLNASADEIISMISTLKFNEAIEIFNDLSQRHLGKIIISNVNIDAPIGIDISNMHWLDAMEAILTNHGLVYEEFSNHLLIKMPEKEKGVDKKLLSMRDLFETREVVISAVFFELNKSKLRQMGTSWEFRDVEGDYGGQMTAGDLGPTTVQLDFLREFDFGDITAFFRVMENAEAGDILANPQVTVRSGNEGMIQVGSDFSVTTQDFAGNTVTQFFSTGAIITVTPEIVTYDSTTFIHLTLDVQRSSAAQSDLGIEVKKTQALTSILLLDGEETIIGGLYSSEESIKRDGVPFLKDLPGWMFGLRYLFGFEKKTYTNKELIILIRAQLVPSLEQRMDDRKKNPEKQSNFEELLKRFKKEIDRNIELKKIQSGE